MLARVERGILVATLDIAGCSRSASVDSSDADSNVASSSTPAEEATSELAAAPVFAGTWKQANSGSDDAYQATDRRRFLPIRPLSPFPGGGGLLFRGRPGTVSADAMPELRGTR